MYDLIFARKLLDTRGDFCENLARFVPSGSSLLSVFLLLFPFTFRLGLTKTWRKRESHAVCPTSDVIIQCGCNRTSSEYAKNMNSSRTSDIFFLLFFLLKQSNFFVSLIPARVDSNVSIILRAKKQLRWIYFTCTWISNLHTRTQNMNLLFINYFKPIELLIILNWLSCVWKQSFW